MRTSPNTPAPAILSRFRPASPHIVAAQRARARIRAHALPMAIAAVALCAVGVPAATADGPAVIDRARANAIVWSADRVDADRNRDVRRSPAEFLVFARIGPGMTAADIGAGDGYTTELLARAVGPKGRVYGHNTPTVVEKYVSETWPARLARPVNANVVRVDREIASPLPRSAKDLDVVTMIFTYHDTYLSRRSDFDHKRYLRGLHKKMKPGGRIIVVDHRAKEGARGAEVFDELHRIDEALVKEDFEAAGFVLEATAEFMSNADDPRVAPFFKMDLPTDAFVHRWVKPKG